MLGYLEMNRIVIVDEKDQSVKIKTDKQLIEENEEIIKLLGMNRSKEMESKDEVKEAMREGDDAMEELLARKKAEKQAKAQAKPEKKEVKAVAEERRVSLNFGVIGAGQAGSKLAKVFYDYGYDVCALNTAKQDLELLDIPEDHKFFMDYSGVGQGGAGRELDVGNAAIVNDYKDVKEFVEEHTDGSDVLVLCTSLGGGSGAGAAPVLVDMCNEIGKPVIVLGVLPGSSDDSQSKHNAVETLAELGDRAAHENINSLILVDNAKIETTFPDLSPAKFWSTANSAIVTPLHIFNSVSACPTDYEALDSMDFAKSLLEAGNCVIFGSTEIEPEVYEDDDTAIVEAIIDNLEKGLLADEFDLEEAQTVGVLITGKAETLDKIPYRAISYAFKYITTEYNSARTFKGVYAMPSDTDELKVHFIFSGMSLPKARIESLQKEAKKHMKNLEDKKKVSKAHMQIDRGGDRASHESDQMLRRLKNKKGVMNKLIKGGKRKVVDRRR